MGDAASFVSIIVITVLGIVLAGIRTLEQLQRSRDELDAWSIAAKAAKSWEGAGSEQRSDLQVHGYPLGRQPPMQASGKITMWRGAVTPFSRDRAKGRQTASDLEPRGIS